MTFLYLDSSALVKRYVAESGSDDVIALMADAAAVATSLVTRAEVELPHLCGAQHRWGNSTTST